MTPAEFGMGVTRGLLLLLAAPALAQLNNAGATNHSVEVPNLPPGQFHTQTNPAPSLGQRVEAARWDCIQNRRIICGKVVKVLPHGLVIDSGYTDLMRPPLNRSWLVPGTARARRAENLVEDNHADSVCIGLVYLTGLPKKPVAKQYDYVILAGYPTGPYDYTSVGDVRRTVRGFSTKLNKSVRWKLEETRRQNAPSK